MFVLSCPHSQHGPYRGPRPSSPWTWLQLHSAVYSTAANRPRMKRQREKKRVKGEEVKRRIKNRGFWCLGFWSLSIKGPPSQLLWRERGEEGGGSECIPLSSSPGGVSALAAEWGNEGRRKPLQTRRPRLAGDRRVHRFERSDWPEEPADVSLLLRTDVPYQTVLSVRIKVLLEERHENNKRESVDRKHVPLRTELNSFQLFGASQRQSSQGRKRPFHIFRPYCRFLGFSPWLVLAVSRLA